MISFQSITTRVRTLGAPIILSIGFLAACSEPESTANNPIKASATPVEVAKVIAEEITEWDQFSGRVEAPHTVSLRPRVSGYIDYIAFEEGALVKQGQPLFFIDNRAYKAEVKRLRAALQTARSQVELTEKELNRAIGLQAKNAISQENVDNRQARFDQAKASLAATQAELDVAKLNLSFTRVEAPIAGRISQALITKGNYVNAGQSILTSIVSTDQLYVYFDADEQSLLKYNRLAEEGKRASTRGSQHPVFMGLINDQGYPYTGYIDFIDNQVNQSTGTIRSRAVFENKDEQLLPGLFARIKVAGSATYSGVLIDDKAIATDLNNRYVMVVNDANHAEYRQVTLGEKVNGLRVIKQGLNAGDKIVVGGMQRIRPGALLAPTEVPMADAKTLQALRREQQRIEQLSEAHELAEKPSTDTAAQTGA